MYLNFKDRTLTYYNNYVQIAQFTNLKGEEFYFVIGVSAHGLRAELNIPDYHRYFGVQ